MLTGENKTPGTYRIPSRVMGAVYLPRGLGRLPPRRTDAYKADTVVQLGGGRSERVLLERSG